MQGQIACCHLRTGSVYGSYKCKINNEKPTGCIGLYSRCECQTLRQHHDRWMPTEATYKIESVRE